MRMRTPILMMAALAAQAMAWGHGAAQSRGLISGYVVDALTSEQIGGARVSLHGTRIGAETDDWGQFELESVPPGTVIIRVEAAGYSAMTQEVTIQSGVATLLWFEMVPLAVVLDSMLVSVRGGGDGEDEIVAAAGSTPATMLLRQTSPGVFVSVGSGYADTNATVLIRGMKSLVLDNDPAVYVDGIRVSGGSLWSGAPRGGGTSVLDNLSASDIAEIRVLRGPAAASLYPDASNGVIVIRTKGSLLR